MVGFSSCLDLLMDGRVISSKTSYLFDLKTALILTVLFFETKLFKLAKRSWSLLNQKNDFCDNFTVNRLGFGVNDILPEKLVGIIQILVSQIEFLVLIMFCLGDRTKNSVRLKNTISKRFLSRYDDLINVYVPPSINNCPATTNSQLSSFLPAYKLLSNVKLQNKKADIEKDVSFILRLFPLLQY